MYRGIREFVFEYIQDKAYFANTCVESLRPDSVLSKSIVVSLNPMVVIKDRCVGGVWIFLEGQYVRRKMFPG